MKTLYVSDLDGTLLGRDQKTSDFTNSVINTLVGQGMMFTYATARSLVTAKRAAKGLDAQFPVIIYNGAFTVENNSGKVLLSNYFGDSAKGILDSLLSSEISPIVYAFINGKEKFSYCKETCTPAAIEFIKSREMFKDDTRPNPVENEDELYNGDIFYFTCIDCKEKLAPLYEKYKEKHRCVFSQDIYTKEWWLEIMPNAATKANAILQLKEYLGCNRIVAFGDGKNDIDMFEIADESYAVENAHAELKARATAIIDSNNSDGVARWLAQNFKRRT